MDLPRALDLMSAWEVQPPVHWMVAAYLRAGKKKRKTKEKRQQKGNDWSGLEGLIPVTRRKREQPE